MTTIHSISKMGDLMSKEECETDLSKKKKITKECKFVDGSNPELLSKSVTVESDRIEQNKGKDIDPLAHKSGPSASNKEATPRTPGVTKKRH